MLKKFGVEKTKERKINSHGSIETQVTAIREEFCHFFLLTCVAYSETAQNKVGALRAGAGVAAWSEETQVAAGSLAGVLDCKHRRMALLILLQFICTASLSFSLYYWVIRVNLGEFLHATELYLCCWNTEIWVSQGPAASSLLLVPPPNLSCRKTSPLSWVLQ